MVKQEFDLTDQHEGRQFLLQILNFTSYIQSPSDRLRKFTKGDLINFTHYGKNLPSVSAKSSKGSQKAKQSASHHSILDPIAENREGDGEGGVIE